jgi:hypothetical protein
MAETEATNERWPVLLEERAAYINGIKNVAVVTQLQLVERGLNELAGIYDSAADVLRKAEPTQSSSDTPIALIQRLEQKAHAFLQLAGKMRDTTQAHQLRSLSTIYGGEAQRLQADAA